MFSAGWRSTGTNPNNTGPATTGSAYLFIPLKRNVKSAYGAALVPLISPEMGIPLVNKMSPQC